MTAPSLPVYVSIKEVAKHMPSDWTLRKVRDALVDAGVTRNLGSTPERPGRRTVVVTEQLRERLPEIHQRLFDDSLE